MKNYYQILGLEFSASEIDIKKAYRKFALKYHPDVNKDTNAAEAFIKATEAYEVLRDPSQREKYDRIYEVIFREEATQNHHQGNIDFKESYQKWEHFGRQKAQEYAAIPFEEFARRLLKEISIGVGYIPNVIAILITGAIAISMLFFLPWNFGDSMGIILISISIGLGYLTYRLFLVAKKDYSEERKQKIFNK